MRRVEQLAVLGAERESRGDEETGRALALSATAAFHAFRLFGNERQTEALVFCRDLTGGTGHGGTRGHDEGLPFTKKAPVR